MAVLLRGSCVVGLPGSRQPTAVVPAAVSRPLLPRHFSHARLPSRSCVTGLRAVPPGNSAAQQQPPHVQQPQRDEGRAASEEDRARVLPASGSEAPDKDHGLPRFWLWWARTCFSFGLLGALIAGAFRVYPTALPFTILQQHVPAVAAVLSPNSKEESAHSPVAQSQQRTSAKQQKREAKKAKKAAASSSVSSEEQQQTQQAQQEAHRASSLRGMLRFTWRMIDLPIRTMEYMLLGPHPLAEATPKQAQPAPTTATTADRSKQEVAQEAKQGTVWTAAAKPLEQVAALLHEHADAVAYVQKLVCAFLSLHLVLWAPLMLFPGGRRFMHGIVTGQPTGGPAQPQQPSRTRTYPPVLHAPKPAASTTSPPASSIFAQLIAPPALNCPNPVEISFQWEPTTPQPKAASTGPPPSAVFAQVLAGADPVGDCFTPPSQTQPSATPVSLTSATPPPRARDVSPSTAALFAQVLAGADPVGDCLTPSSQTDPHSTRVVWSTEPRASEVGPTPAAVLAAVLAGGDAPALRPPKGLAASMGGGAPTAAEEEASATEEEEKGGVERAECEQQQQDVKGEGAGEGDASAAATAAAAAFGSKVRQPAGGAIAEGASADAVAASIARAADVRAREAVREKARNAEVTAAQAGIAAAVAAAAPTARAAQTEESGAPAAPLTQGAKGRTGVSPITGGGSPEERVLRWALAAQAQQQREERRAEQQPQQEQPQQEQEEGQQPPQQARGNADSGSAVSGHAVSGNAADGAAAAAVAEAEKRSEAAFREWEGALRSWWGLLQQQQAVLRAQQAAQQQPPQQQQQQQARKAEREVQGHVREQGAGAATEKARSWNKERAQEGETAPAASSPSVSSREKKKQKQAARAARRAERDARLAQQREVQQAQQADAEARANATRDDCYGELAAADLWQQMVAEQQQEQKERMQERVQHFPWGEICSFDNEASERQKREAALQADREEDEAIRKVEEEYQLRREPVRLCEAQQGETEALAKQQEEGRKRDLAYDEMLQQLSRNKLELLQRESAARREAEEAARQQAAEKQGGVTHLEDSLRKLEAQDGTKTALEQLEQAPREVSGPWWNNAAYESWDDADTGSENGEYDVYSIQEDTDSDDEVDLKTWREYTGWSEASEQLERAAGTWMDHADVKRHLAQREADSSALGSAAESEAAKKPQQQTGEERVGKGAAGGGAASADGDAGAARAEHTQRAERFAPLPEDAERVTAERVAEGAAARGVAMRDWMRGYVMVHNVKEALDRQAEERARAHSNPASVQQEKKEDIKTDGSRPSDNNNSDARPAASAKPVRPEAPLGMAGSYLPARPEQQQQQQQQQQVQRLQQHAELLQQQEPQVVETPEGLFLPPSSAIPTALPLPRVQRVLPWHAASKGELVVTPAPATAPTPTAAPGAEGGEGAAKSSANDAVKAAAEKVAAEATAEEGQGDASEASAAIHNWAQTFPMWYALSAASSDKATGSVDSTSSVDSASDEDEPTHASNGSSGAATPVSGNSSSGSTAKGTHSARVTTPSMRAAAAAEANNNNGKSVDGKESGDSSSRVTAQPGQGASAAFWSTPRAVHRQRLQAARAAQAEARSAEPQEAARAVQRQLNQKLGKSQALQAQRTPPPPPPPPMAQLPPLQQRARANGRRM